MSIRWTIQDRATGQAHRVLGPSLHRNRDGSVAADHDQKEGLGLLIKNCSSVSLKEQKKRRYRR